MLGTRRARFLLAIVGFCMAASFLGCKKSSSADRTTPATGRSEEAGPRPSRLTRPEIACRLHSCAPPYYCNQSSGICELLSCGSDRDCPYDYHCDFSKHVCQ